MTATQLEQTIRHDGYAQVIAILHRGAAAAAGAEHAPDFKRHFMDPAIADARASGAVPASAPHRGLALGSPAGLRRAEVPPPLHRRVRIFPRLGLALGYIDDAGLAGLRAAPGVSDVVPAEMPGLIRPLRAILAEPPVQPSWGVIRIGAPAMWSQGYKGQGVLVGHADTGIDDTHPALAGAVHAFAEFDLNGDAVPGARAWDSGDHGTHTAGTILGRASAGGAFGVAPAAMLVSAMVIDGGTIIARILAGMEWAVVRGVPILSASLGLREQGTAFQALVNGLRNNNVLPIFAVGNESFGTSRFPGNCHNVLSIGACDAQDRVAFFSGSQRFLGPQPRIAPDLVAPGVDILSCLPNTRHARGHGPAMAASHIAGLAALLLSAEPSATAADLALAIRRSCQVPAGMDPGRGHPGIPDAIRALAALRAS